MTVRVAVIGAGIAAARTLTEVGVEVVVFERGRITGGRCGSRRTSAGPFDHGAQYFTVRDQRFSKLVGSVLKMCIHWLYKTSLNR